jgi:single-stranded DNA-binding protein
MSQCVFLKKGGKITIAGRAKSRAYLRKDGTAGCSLEVDVYDFTLPLRAEMGTSGASDEVAF